MRAYSSKVLDSTTVDIEVFDSSTGEYINLQAKNPPDPGIELDGNRPTAVTTSGFLLGFMSDVPSDLGYRIVTRAYVSWLSATPPATVFEDVAMLEYANPRKHQVDDKAVVLADNAVLVLSEVSGALDIQVSAYGDWPVNTDISLPIGYADGSVRLIQLDWVANKLRLSTAVGTGDLGIEAVTTPHIPALVDDGDVAREVGAFNAAKAMNLGKTYGAPTMCSGVFIVYHESGLNPFVEVQVDSCVTCPDSASSFSYYLLGLDLDLVTRVYTADPGFTAFSLINVDSVADPTSSTADDYWISLSAAINPQLFWTGLKLAAEII